MARLKCEKCERKLKSLRQIEDGKLLYACGGGHPNLLQVETLEQARECGEILAQKTIDGMSKFFPNDRYSLKWTTPNRLAILVNGEQLSCIDVDELPRGH